MNLPLVSLLQENIQKNFKDLYVYKLLSIMFTNECLDCIKIPSTVLGVGEVEMSRPTQPTMFYNCSNACHPQNY
jgi:hypothetical protein